MVNMKIDHFVVGPVQTNCYFVTNIKTKEMIIIDPGACAEQLAKKVDESGAKPVAILLTHGHFDHATDAKPLADRYGIKIYIHEADKATLDDPQLNVSYMMGQSKTFYADVFLKDKQEIDIASLRRFLVSLRSALSTDIFVQILFPALFIVHSTAISSPT